MKPDGIILDVDGTLWDSTHIVARAWTRAVHEAGGLDLTVTADMLKEQFGRTMDVITDNLFGNYLPLPKRRAVMKQCCVYEHEALVEDPCRIWYPGVPETIRALSDRMPVFIVSNCQTGYIELFLEKTGLGPYITDTECFGNTGRPKDENIRLVAERNHLQNPVYVGDTAGDQEAAQKAGVLFWFASYGFGQATACDAVLKRFSDLETLLCMNEKDSE